MNMKSMMKKNDKDKEHDTLIIDIVVFAFILGVFYVIVKGFFWMQFRLIMSW